MKNQNNLNRGLAALAALALAALAAPVVNAQDLRQLTPQGDTCPSNVLVSAETATLDPILPGENVFAGVVSQENEKQGWTGIFADPEHLTYTAQLTPLVEGGATLTVYKMVLGDNNKFTCTSLGGSGTVLYAWAGEGGNFEAGQQPIYGFQVSYTDGSAIAETVQAVPYAVLVSPL